MPKDPPKIPDPLLLANTLRFRRDAPAFFVNTLRSSGDSSRFRLGRRLVYLLFHPDHVERILSTNRSNYPRAGYDRLEPLLGAGLLSSEGEAWRSQRRAIQPAFHPQRFPDMVEDMNAAVTDLCGRLDHGAHSGEIVDIEVEMNRLALGMIGRALFGYNVSRQAPEVNEDLSYILRYTLSRIGRLWALPARVSTPARRRYAASLVRLNSVVDTLIAQQRNSPTEKNNGRPNLISELLDFRDPKTGAPFDEKRIRDNVLTFLTAGHETTAKALTWSLYLMARHPEQGGRLRQEAQDLASSDHLTHDTLRTLDFHGMFIRESLRLFTPVPGLARQVVDEDVVGEHRLLPDARVIVSPYATHRHPDFWLDPGRFDPERFKPGTKTYIRRHPYAYFPFGRGPRQCIGTNFAQLEMKLALAVIARRYTLSLPPGHDASYVPTETLFTLRPKYGMPVHVAHAA
ncbi:MAG: cytochrome P450 [Rubrobacteraceae bacterium]